LPRGNSLSHIGKSHIRFVHDPWDLCSRHACGTGVLSLCDAKAIKDNSHLSVSMAADDTLAIGACRCRLNPSK
jgi:hypothetical protein